MQIKYNIFFIGYLRVKDNLFKNNIKYNDTKKLRSKLFIKKEIIYI